MLPNAHGDNHGADPQIKLPPVAFWCSTAIIQISLNLFWNNGRVFCIVVGVSAPVPLDIALSIGVAAKSADFTALNGKTASYQWVTALDAPLGAEIW